jgi:hypothetical protein
MRAPVPLVTRGRLIIVGGVVLTVVAALVVGLADPFGSPSQASSLDNGTATSIATIARRDLSEQTQVSATLGYADPSTIAVPSGTAPAAVEQAQQQESSARAALASAQAAHEEDTATLATARAALTADQAKLSVDCAGSGAAQSGAAQGDGGGASAPCAADAEKIATDRQGTATAQQKVQADAQQIATAKNALTAAEEALREAQASATAYGQTSVYTMLPPVGRIVRRGRPLYAIGGEPTLLLYGSVVAWRPFEPGMSPGRDVAALNGNLGLRGDAFTAATAAAVRSFQASHGAAATGTLLLGSVVFEPGAVRVTSVTPTQGSAVQPGAVIGITSTRRVVTIELDASQQSSVIVGDAVSITLPDNSTTPGRVTYVGSVATTPSADQGGGGSATPTIEVDVTPTQPGATGRLDQAPVDVSITTSTVPNVLAVPVNALLALASGGYAVEAVGAGGVHTLVAAQVGLFDDAAGLVQVQGPSLHAGLRVVVPGS